MAPVHKIAVIQLHPKPLQPAANFATAASFIRSAATQKCALAVLPEYHLTNWMPQDAQFRVQCAESPKYLAAYIALARECDICIVPGTLVEVQPNGNLINVAYFISNTGEILGRYIKKNLWHPERPHLANEEGDVLGDESPADSEVSAEKSLSSSSTTVDAKSDPAKMIQHHRAFDTPIGRVGMLICWDLAFPEGCRALVADGAEIIIVPAFWALTDCNEDGLRYNPQAEELLLDSMLVSRAYENTCAMIFVNAGAAVGKGTRNTYAGVSQVTVPFLGSVGRLGREEGMNVVELDMQILRIAEENYRVREDMRKEGWHYAYTLPSGDRKGKL